MLENGLFISLEGLDCSGKSTVAKLLNNYFVEKGYNVVVTREPGGHNIVFCEKIRSILLDKDNKITDISEAFLFAASRFEHINKLLLPEIKKGSIIICDRFLDSSLVYQGYAKEIGIENVMEINKYSAEVLLPDITFLLDININTYNNRIQERAELDRCDLLSLKLGEKIIDGYHYVANLYNNRIFTIDANVDIDIVFNKIINIIEDKYEV